MDIESGLKFLYSLHTFGVKLGLENIQGFLNKLDNPQNKIKTIHVAGSNGKGSTASFITSMLMEMGYKTGLYTSPHFVKFNERIVINNIQITDNYIADFVNTNSDYIKQNQLTFFEVTTAMAFKYFYENNVDYGVIEVGLGGRLDATNVIKPIASVITSISLEHTNILGDTIKKIASEKAAIIKDNSKVFVGKLPNDAALVVEEKCKETNSVLYKVEGYVNVKDDNLKLILRRNVEQKIELDDHFVPLKGSYQKFNAALAGLVVSEIISKSNMKFISRGIKNVIKNTGLEGRFEYYLHNPDIIFDSAHNPDGIKNFLNEFNKLKNKYGKKVLLFGVMRDKAVKEMLKMCSAYFDEIHVTQISYERSCKIEELQRIAVETKITVLPESNPSEYVRKFKEHNPDNCLVVLGSMYLLAEIKTSLQKV